MMLPKHAFKGDSKNVIGQAGTNLNSLFIQGQTEFKTKALNDGVGVNLVNSLNSINSLNSVNSINASNLNQLSHLSQLGSRSANINKNNLDINLNEGFVKAFLEKFLDHSRNESRNEAKREKLDFLPMLTSSNEKELINLGLHSTSISNNINAQNTQNTHNTQNINSNNSYLHSNINNINIHNNKQIPIAHTDAISPFSNKISTVNKALSLTNQIRSPLRSTYELPKIDLEDPRDSLFRNPSPNPFLEDINYSPSPNLFHSPKHIDAEPLNFFSRNNSGQIQGDNNDNNLMCLNNFGSQNGNTRNNSIDLNDLFKNSHPGNEEEFAKKLLHGEKDYVFDDSYFSVSSDKQRSEVKSDYKLDEI